MPLKKIAKQLLFISRMPKLCVLKTLGAGEIVYVKELPAMQYCIVPQQTSSNSLCNFESISLNCEMSEALLCKTSHVDQVFFKKWESLFKIVGKCSHYLMRRITI